MRNFVVVDRYLRSRLALVNVATIPLEASLASAATALRAQRLAQNFHQGGLVGGSVPGVVAFVVCTVLADQSLWLRLGRWFRLAAFGWLG